MLVCRWGRNRHGHNYWMGRMSCSGIDAHGICIDYPHLGRLLTPAETCAECRRLGGWPHPSLELDDNLGHCRHRQDTGERVTTTCSCTWIICQHPGHGEVKPRLNSRTCNATCKLYQESA